LKHSTEEKKKVKSKFEVPRKGQEEEADLKGDGTLPKKEKHFPFPNHKQAGKKRR